MKRMEGWKKTRSMVLALFIFTMSLSPILINNSICAETSFVEATDSLQDKINDSSNGDTIKINQSVTLSNFIEINRSITLTGNESSSIIINGSNFGLNITTNNVSIQNLTITNCSTALNLINNSETLENITLNNLTLQNCSNHGIYADNINDTTISNITITNCTDSGIKINNSANLSIKYNTIWETNTGLNLSNHTNNNTIFNNTFSNNTISLNITSSENNTIVNNTFLNKTGTYHAYDNSTHNKWNTTTHGNYWGNYQDTDSNEDSRGDNPYNISGGANKDHQPLGFFRPIVNFTFEPSSPTTSNTINFTDNSTDPNNENTEPLTYSWDFGDGNTSEEQNPSHNYTENDQTYIVTLNVTNQYGQSNQTSQTIIINNSAPTSLFTWSPQPGIVNEAITFTSNCSDSDGADDSLSYNWSFGEGLYYKQQDSTHTYNQSGDYSVILNVTDNDGNTTSSSQTITVTNKPSVNFSFSPSSPITSDTITFTDTSTDSDGSISSYNWSFGDGSYSEDEQPTHSYSYDGTYTVLLNVTDNDGATNQTSLDITVLNTPPVANFTFSPQNATDLQKITFTNCSTDPDGHITNCTWNFGDETTNYSMNTTTHQYDDNGTYTITLNVTDNSSASHEYSINITVSNVGPTADFTFEPNHPEIGETIWFNDTSTDEDGSIVNRTWDFGDNTLNYSENTTHSFSKLQSYDVSLTITDNDNNKTTITKHVILKETTTKQINTTEPASLNLLEEAHTKINIKTKNATNLSVSAFSECPEEADENIADYENLETYVDITIENETLLDWINFSVYYTEEDIENDIDETTLTLYYWNETIEEWINISNSKPYTSNTDSYSGFVQANISHLTLFTIAGQIIEEEETIQPTLPAIINSSNNTLFTTVNPILNITYSQIVPNISATFNGSNVLLNTTDNKTFNFFIKNDLSNGNYSLQIHLSNKTLSRTDTIHFSIILPTQAQTDNKPVNIPFWIWYSILFIMIIGVFWLLDLKKIILNILPNRKEAITSEPLTSENKNTSNGLIKDTFLSINQSMKSIDTLLFGNLDPWEQEKEEINHTLYNIDLFAEKPDSYVGIQQKLLTEDPTCKNLINLITQNEQSINEIKNKTEIKSKDLSQQLSILMKYGLIEERKQDYFRLTSQAKKILKRKEELD